MYLRWAEFRGCFSCVRTPQFQFHPETHVCSLLVSLGTELPEEVSQVSCSVLRLQEALCPAQRDRVSQHCSPPPSGRPLLPDTWCKAREWKGFSEFSFTLMQVLCNCGLLSTVPRPDVDSGASYLARGPESRLSSLGFPALPSTLGRPCVPMLQGGLSAL